jgi:ABC-2 type transport system permease protein
MRKLLAIAKKEIYITLHSPVPFIALGVFALVIGFLFNSFIYQYMVIQKQQMMFQQGFGQLDIHMLIQGTFKNIHFLFLILIPFLTMRVIAEERANQTTQLLFSAPLTITQILGGKFLGMVAVLLMFIAYTVFVPVFTMIYSQPDVPMILYSYVGFLMVGMAYVSIGMFCSSVTQNQMLAGVLAFILGFAFFLFGVLTQNLQNVAGEILGHLSITQHSENFFKGIFSLKDVVFFITFSFFWLFMTHRVLDSQSWR